MLHPVHERERSSSRPDAVLPVRRHVHRGCFANVKRRELLWLQPDGGGNAAADEDHGSTGGDGADSERLHEIPVPMREERPRAGIVQRFSQVCRCAVLLPTVLAVSTCGRNPSGPSPLPAGMWGGDHVAMTVAETATHLEFDCAHGDIPAALMVDARNEFDVAGTFVREHGGPIRDGETADARPARYVGSVGGGAMALTVRLTDTNETIGTFALARGSPGRVMKCL